MHQPTTSLQQEEQLGSLNTCGPGHQTSLDNLHMKEPWERKGVLFGIRLYCFASLCLNLCPHWFSTPGIPVSIFGCPRSGEGTGLLVSTAGSPEVLTTLLHA